MFSHHARVSRQQRVSPGGVTCVKRLLSHTHTRVSCLHSARAILDSGRQPSEMSGEAELKNEGVSPIEPTVEAVWPKIKDWVEARRNDGQTANDVIEALGLTLLNGATQSEESRWVTAAMAVAQYKAQLAPRSRSDRFDCMDKVVELLRCSQRILVVSGAGASSAVTGFSAFFEGDGEIHAAYDRKLSHPADLFEAGHFVRNPLPLLSYVRYLTEVQQKPASITPSHKLLGQLQRRGTLLRNYSQNIDGLERVAGIESTLACHGTISSATCLSCKARIGIDACAEDLAAGRPLTCPSCTNEVKLLKPDVAFLGESGASQTDLAQTEAALRTDLQRADLLLVLGASLDVEPLRSVAPYLHRTVPQVLITPSGEHAFKHEWDVELRGQCDAVASYLCRQLGWDIGGGATDEGFEPAFEGNGLYRFAPDEALAPPQTPLAVQALLGEKRSAKRGSVTGLTGATLGGSGVGARSALATSAPIVPPSTVATSDAAGAGGKRPLENAAKGEGSMKKAALAPE